MTVFLEDYGELALVNYIDLTEKQKSDVLAMRNHPEIKKWMYTQDDILLADHLAFIERLKQDHTKIYFLVLRQGQAIGTVNFKEIDRNKRSAEFALFANPFNSLSSAGRMLLGVATRYASDKIGLTSMTLEALKHNERAINLYTKSGFLAVGTKLVNNQDVLCMQKEIGSIC